MFRQYRPVLRFIVILLVIFQMNTFLPLDVLAAPAAPAQLTVTVPVNGNQLKLDWGQVAGAAQYKVYRRSVNDVVYTPLTTVSTINFTDTGLAPKTIYYYQVTAIGSDNSESAPAIVSATTYDSDSTIPTTPGNVAAAALSQPSIRLSWSASTDVAGIREYEIYYRVSTTANYTKTTVAHPATTFTHNGLIPGRMYYYYVKAIDNYGNPSPASATVSATTLADTEKPAQPTNLSATVEGLNRINLIWNASTDNVEISGYKVYRITGTSTVTLSPGNVTSYSDTGLAPGTTYIYKVSAVDTAGNESDPSLQISRTTTYDNQPPPAPASLTATVESAASIKLQWNGVTDNVGLNGYEVWRGTTNGNYPTKLVLTSSTSYTDNYLSANTRYYYKVVAVDTSGNVSPGVYADALTQTDSIKPEPPALVTARASSSKTKVYLNWSGASDNMGVVSYEVYRSVGSGTAARLTSTGSTSYDDTDVSANNTYKYYIVAVDGAGNRSANSITVSVTTNGDPEGPTPPVNLKVTLANDNETKLSWTASTDVTGVNGYYVYRAVGSGSFYQLATTTGTSYTDKNLSFRETYRYYVVAFDTAGNTSAESGKESIYTSLKHQNMTGYISADSDGVVELADGFIRLEVPAGAIENSGLFTLNVKTLGDYSAKGFYKVGRVVDITAEKIKGSTGSAGSTGGTVLKKNATLIFRYDSADLLGYITGRLGIYKWDTTAKTWRRLNTYVNTSARKVWAGINELGVYGLLIDTDAPRVPEFIGPDKDEELTSRVFLLKGKGEPYSKVQVSVNWSIKYIFDVTDKGDYSGEVLLARGENRLRVRGVDDAGNTGEWSEEKVFKAGSQANLADTANHWAEINIVKLVEAGVAGGYGDNTFRPDKTITRAEFTKFVVTAVGLSGGKNGRSGRNTGRSGGEQEISFTDSGRIPDWAKESVAAAVKAGIISGYADGTFKPDRLVSREEMAVMLVRALNLEAEAAKKDGAALSFADNYAVSSWARGAVAVAVEKGLVSGYGDNSFKPYKNASRAEAATMIIKFMDLKKGKKS